jgi:hypothetical protein
MAMPSFLHTAPVGTSLRHRSAKLPDDMRPNGRHYTDKDDGCCVVEIPLLEGIMRSTSDTGTLGHSALPPCRHRVTAPAATAAPPSGSTRSAAAQHKSSLVRMPQVKQLQYASLDTHSNAVALTSGEVTLRTNSDSSTHDALGLSVDRTSGTGASLNARSTAGSISLGGSAPSVGDRQRDSKRTSSWSFAGLLGSRRGTRDALAVRCITCPLRA